MLTQLRRYAAHLSFFPPLVIRLIMGFIFFQSGLGKLRHLSNVVEFFTSLGIPFPQLQAPFVAGVEFLGGLCLLVGLGTRYVSVPLACTMIVALLTAKKDALASFSTLTETSEFLYLLLLLALTGLGSGMVSLDHLFCRRKDPIT